MTFTHVFDAALDAFQFDQVVAGLHRSGPRFRLLRIVRGQLRPDRSPVVRSQVFARDLAACFALDGDAIFRAGPAVRVAVLPLSDLHLALRADAVFQLGYAERAFAVQVVVELHGAEDIAFAKPCQ